MEALGPRLKRTREAQNLSLKEIEGRTKISTAALEALERGDFSKLPGGIFGRAFVRTYATELGLNPDAIVAEFLEQLGISEREAAERARQRPEITADDREFLERQRRAVRGLRIGLVVVAVSLALFGLWQMRGFVWSGPPPPAPSAAAAEPAAQAPPATPEPVVPVPESVPAPPPSNAAVPLSITLTATADCWVYAGADGGRVVSELLRPGDTRVVNATREIVLDVGNAGGLTYTVNGKPGRALGRAGAHVRVTVRPETVSDFLAN